MTDDILASGHATAVEPVPVSPLRDGIVDAWQPIATAPKDGTRVRVAHELDKNSMKPGAMFQTTAVFEYGGWDLTSYFIIPGGRYGMLVMEPTHWMPMP